MMEKLGVGITELIEKQQGAAMFNNPIRMTNDNQTSYAFTITGIQSRYTLEHKLAFHVLSHYPFYFQS